MLTHMNDWNTLHYFALRSVPSIDGVDRRLKTMERNGFVRGADFDHLPTWAASTHKKQVKTDGRRRKARPGEGQHRQHQEVP